MDRSRAARVFSPIVLEQLEQRLAPASSIFEDQVTNLYRFGLNRSPEAGGLQAHVRNLESGTPLKTVAGAIFSSEEHQRSLISSYYRVFLDRDPDSAGLNSLVAAARNGASSEQILATFLSAPEYIGADTNDETYVNFLYQQVLGRAGDEAGIASHVAALKNGTSRFDVALAFLESKENDSTEIRALYQNILGRSPSEPEIQGWVSRLAAPEVDLQDGVVAFLSSPEGAGRIGADLVFGNEYGNDAWFMDDVGQHSLTVRTLGGPSAGQELVLKLANQIRAVETFSNPENMGQIFEQLVKEDYPNIGALNKDVPTTGTLGASAYSEDLRNTPGAFQVDLANIGKVNPYNDYIEVFGLWDGKAGASKNPKSSDVEIAFTRDTLASFLGVQVDANGLITSATREAASVLLHNESLALAPDFNAASNPLIGRHIDSLKREQLSMYLAGRVGNDGTVKMADDRRVAPEGVVAAALRLQYQTSKSYMYGVLKTYASHDSYSEVFAKAQALFGSTLKITSSQTAFGITKGDVFWSRFNAGFITGGAYVSGINAMFGLYSGLVDADENGTGSWTVDGTTITFTKVVNNDPAAPKVFTVDKTPVNLSDTYPSIFHYGAVLSPIEIDPFIGDPDLWGVTGRKGDLDYTRMAATQTQQGGGTLPSGGKAWSYQYKGLEDSQKITAVGSDCYDIVPVPVALADVVTVDNSGYGSSAGPNNNQVVAAGNKIDMSAYGLTMDQAYPDMYYVDTNQTPYKVAHVSDVTFQAPKWGLYMYYVNGAGGDLAKATEAITNFDVTWKEPYKYSYRVSVKDTSVLGHPANAAEFGTHFIMQPPPPPPQGTGVIDASALTGSLHVATDTSIIKVLLGSGANSIDAGSQGTGVEYVLNTGMEAGTVSTVIRNLRLGTDKVDLTGFGTINELAVNVVASFDNNVKSPQLAKLYPRYTDTVEVSFTAGAKSYRFLVLASSNTQSAPDTVKAGVLSSLVS